MKRPLLMRRLWNWLIDGRDFLVGRDNSVRVAGDLRRDDVTRARSRNLGERDAYQGNHLSRGDSRRGDVIIVMERGPHDVEHALRMIGDVDKDEKIASGARTKPGKSSKAPPVIDLFPDVDQLVTVDRCFDRRQELARLTKVDELDLVGHAAPYPDASSFANLVQTLEENGMRQST